MWKIRSVNTFLNICILSGFILLIYYAFLTQDSINHRKHLRRSVRKNTENVIGQLTLLPRHAKEYNIWLVFTKVTNVSTLSYKFRDLIHNLLNVSSIPLRFNIIVDKVSQAIAENQIADVIYRNKTMVYSFYDIEESAKKIQDIVEVMTPHFSSKPGTYYSDALFYISLGLYRIAPQNQDFAILLDCDLYFKKDVAPLFNLFSKVCCTHSTNLVDMDDFIPLELGTETMACLENMLPRHSVFSFKPGALFGLAPELTPVYRHILHMYKANHNTTFGEFYHDSNISRSIHPRGFQGYNSGVVLINLKAQRNSTEFLEIISNSTVQRMTAKYRFRGHLGDQDFYTLVGNEYPHLIQTISCKFNRQLCTWWRDHGYSNIFEDYFKCHEDIVVLHGNCNTRIPK